MMEHEQFRAWLADADGLAPWQRDEAARMLAEPASLASVLALLETRIDESRRCPHRAVEGGDSRPVERARALGLQGLRQDRQRVDRHASGPAAQ